MTHSIAFYAQFIASAVGANGLTVTWDVERITRADGTRSALVTGAATNITIGRRGLYGYLLADADLETYDYVATAVTAGTADQNEIAALWSHFAPDVQDDTGAILDDTGTAGVVLANDAITAAKIAADAIGSSELATTAVVEIASAILAFPNNKIYTDTDGYTIATVVGLSPNAVAEIESGVNATVAVSAAQAAALADGQIALLTHYTFAQAITSTTMDDLSAGDLVFAAKRAVRDADSSAVLLLSKVGGLTVVDQDEYATAADGQVAVSGEAGAWSVALTLAGAVTSLLTGYAGSTLYAELKHVPVSGVGHVVWSGKLTVAHGIVREL